MKTKTTVPSTKRTQRIDDKSSHDVAPIGIQPDLPDSGELGWVSEDDPNADLVGFEYDSSIADLSEELRRDFYRDSADLFAAFMEKTKSSKNLNQAGVFLLEQCEMIWRDRAEQVERKFGKENLAWNDFENGCLTVLIEMALMNLNTSRNDIAGEEREKL